MANILHHMLDEKQDSGIRPYFVSRFLRQLILKEFSLDEDTLPLSWNELGLSITKPSTATGKSGRPLGMEDSVWGKSVFRKEQSERDISHEDHYTTTQGQHKNEASNSRENTSTRNDTIAKEQSSTTYQHHITSDKAINKHKDHTHHPLNNTTSKKIHHVFEQQIQDTLNKINTDTHISDSWFMNEKINMSQSNNKNKQAEMFLYGVENNTHPNTQHLKQNIASETIESQNVTSQEKHIEQLQNELSELQQIKQSLETKIQNLLNNTNLTNTKGITSQSNYNNYIPTNDILPTPTSALPSLESTLAENLNLYSNASLNTEVQKLSIDEKNSLTPPIANTSTHPNIRINEDSNIAPISNNPVRSPYLYRNKKRNANIHTAHITNGSLIHNMAGGEQSFSYKRETTPPNLEQHNENKNSNNIIASENSINNNSENNFLYKSLEETTSSRMNENTETKNHYSDHIKTIGNVTHINNNSIVPQKTLPSALIETQHNQLSHYSSHALNSKNLRTTLNSNTNRTTQHNKTEMSNDTHKNLSSDKNKLRLTGIKVSVDNERIHKRSNISPQFLKNEIALHLPYNMYSKTPIKPALNNALLHTKPILTKQSNHFTPKEKQKDIRHISVGRITYNATPLRDDLEEKNKRPTAVMTLHDYNQNNTEDNIWPIT